MMILATVMTVLLASGSAMADLEARLGGASAQAVAGMVLRDRYVLREFLERREVPGKSPPASLGKRGRHLIVDGHLGTGSFGDVWKAYDKHSGKYVAVKIFYAKDEEGTPRYLTWKVAKHSDSLRRMLGDAAAECKLVRDTLLSEANMGLRGATRICACYDVHIPKDHDRVAFLVQELCGKSLTQHYLTPHRTKGTVDVAEARKLVAQLVEGVGFLQALKPYPLIHHDLKPANVCVGATGVKIIDWGGAVWAKENNQDVGGMYTPVYTPPEAQDKTFTFPAHSYDVYSSGLIYLRMLCPAITDLVLKGNLFSLGVFTPLTEETIERMLAEKCKELPKDDFSAIKRDLKVIKDMTNHYPGKRPTPRDLLRMKIFAPPDAVYELALAIWKKEVIEKERKLEEGQCKTLQCSQECDGSLQATIFKYADRKGWDGGACAGWMEERCMQCRRKECTVALSYMCGCCWPANGEVEARTAGTPHAEGGQVRRALRRIRRLLSWAVKRRRTGGRA